MSADDPRVEEPAPPPPAAAPQPAPAPQLPRAPGPSTNRVLIIAGMVVAALVVIYAILSNGGIHFNSGKQAEQQFTVQPYVPPQHLMTTGEEVRAHSQPDVASPTLVIFGPEVALNVTGRVSRGLGNDWYAINWNSQTAFIRSADTVVGEGAPPTMQVRPHEEREIKKPEDEETEDLENRVVEEEPDRGGPFELSGIDWVRAPSQRDFQRYYPRRALYSGQDGRVVLDCVADGRGRLSCSVAEEAPRGFGFGNAAISISRGLRIESRTRDGRSVEGGHLRLPLVFHSE
ncbi:hypothetical protein [Terricaulis sp.]|uniref:hypothetical protein n=1 Tax=Terricaulis sp. TaxID=2768686 RepID=UPI00378322F2